MITTLLLQFTTPLLQLNHDYYTFTAVKAWSLHFYRSLLDFYCNKAWLLHFYRSLLHLYCSKSMITTLLLQ